MSPPHAKGRPRQGGHSAITAPTKAQHPDRTATVQMLVAFATRYLAAGGASLDWAVVRRCPLCGFPHRHVIFEQAGSTFERAPSCARHRVYLVSITDVVPSAASRAHRGAA